MIEIISRISIWILLGLLVLFSLHNEKMILLWLALGISVLNLVLAYIEEEN